MYILLFVSHGMGWILLGWLMAHGMEWILLGWLMAHGMEGDGSWDGMDPSMGHGS